MMNKIIGTLIMVSSLAVNAEVLPKAKPYDSRITAAQYNPENVIRVRAKIGYVTLIQLDKGEKSLPEVGIGDSEAWGIGSVGNNIFLKPTRHNPNTNLILTTNKGRTYSFKLVLSKYPHYIVKMEYDKPKTSSNSGYDIPCSDGTVNFNYGKWGHDAISPKYMWDDGRFTCLKFKDNLELPVVYQVSPDGTESLVNYHLNKDTIVIHSVVKEYRLRVGNQVLGLKSDETISSGYNFKATSLKAGRELNHE
jgi:type IV secretion system protein VirB9